MNPNDFDELLSAIRSLQSDPWTSVFFPAASGVIGVVVGFFLSVAKSAFDRKAARRDAITSSIRERRQAAVDVFSMEAKWIAENYGYMGSGSDWHPHEQARAQTALFNKTGRVSDDVLSKAAFGYLVAIDASQRSYARAAPTGGPAFKPIPSDKQAVIRDEVTATRVACQRWVDEDREAGWLVERVESSRERIRSQRDQSEGAEYVAQHFPR
jgi:hypothetical protein